MILPPLLSNPINFSPSFILGERSADRIDDEIRPKSRRGKPNYYPQDGSTLLNLVSAITPTGANMWKSVEGEYNIWAQQAHRPPWDYDSLKSKYENMINTKTPDAQMMLGERNK